MEKERTIYGEKDITKIRTMLVVCLLSCVLSVFALIMLFIGAIAIFDLKPGVSGLLQLFKSASAYLKNSEEAIYTFVKIVVAYLFWIVMIVINVIGLAKGIKTMVKCISKKGGEASAISEKEQKQVALFSRITMIAILSGAIFNTSGVTKMGMITLIVLGLGFFINSMALVMLASFDKYEILDRQDFLQGVATLIVKSAWVSLMFLYVFANYRGINMTGITNLIMALFGGNGTLGILDVVLRVLKVFLILITLILFNRTDKNANMTLVVVSLLFLALNLLTAVIGIRFGVVGVLGAVLPIVLLVPVPILLTNGFSDELQSMQPLKKEKKKQGSATRS